MKKQLILVFLLAWGCSPAQKKDDTATTAVSTVLDAKTFKDKVASAKGNAVLLDVRTPEEVAEGIIPGAIIMDFRAPDFEDKISKLDKSKDYFVYCKAGIRSTKAVTLMESTGFTKVYNLDGGYDAWVANGFETQKPE
ncbi:MAG: rhodanese-like domain-containing protein [Cyclobacteriaceae bacterium]|nr:rhodanese-like domain-containing protein [Cyclobacteriaceae bacterium]MDH4298659.1 rhodanese-like domain-containing protein [Cyclobacteriaceae bacterium]MDH5250646.1 rhodanese-like domain-containing protein [Cyclobacteriaceae bacterium]